MPRIALSRRVGVAVAAALVLLLTLVFVLAQSAPATAASKAAVPPVFHPNASPSTTVASGVFTPVKPCRIVDTRSGSRFGTNDSKTFNVVGTSSLASQGGSSSGCGIPAYADTISFTITAANTVSHGSLVVYPNGVTKPNVTTLATSIGQTLSTGSVVGLGTSGRITVTSQAKTDVVIDVLGFTAPVVSGTFASDGSSVNSNGTLMPAGHASTGYYSLAADRDLTGCVTTASGYYYAYNVTAYAFGSIVYVEVTNFDGTPANYYFNVTVTC